jgi:hypothetical protein
MLSGGAIYKDLLQISQIGLVPGSHTKAVTSLVCISGELAAQESLLCSTMGPFMLANGLQRRKIL